MASGQKAGRRERDPERRKVVITGIGPVTPVGTGVEEFWTGLIAGRNGVREIARFPTDDLPVKVAGDVHDFEPAKMARPEGDPPHRPLLALRDRGREARLGGRRDS